MTSKAVGTIFTVSYLGIPLLDDTKERGIISLGRISGSDINLNAYIKHIINDAITKIPKLRQHG
jgi:hypothetical protein